MGQFPKNAVRTFRSVNPEISLAELHVAKLDNEMRRKDAFFEVARKNANDQIMMLRDELAKVGANAANLAVEVGQLLEQRKENLERIGLLDQQVRLTAWALDKVQAQRDVAIRALQQVKDAYYDDSVTLGFDGDDKNLWIDALARMDEVLSGADLATDLQHRMETAERERDEALSALRGMRAALDQYGSSAISDLFGHDEAWNAAELAMDRVLGIAGPPEDDDA